MNTIDRYCIRMWVESAQADIAALERIDIVIARTKTLKHRHELCRAWVHVKDAAERTVKIATERGALLHIGGAF